MRDFLLERYSTNNWPALIGEVPFIVSGPKFKDWAIKGSLERHGRWLFRPELRWLLAELFPKTGIHRVFYYQDAVAEFLLREGIAAALWCMEARSLIPEAERWDESVRQLARELPFPPGEDFVEWTFEMLCGIPSPEMARSYVAEDSLTLTPVVIPPEPQVVVGP